MELESNSVAQSTPQVQENERYKDLNPAFTNACFVMLG